MNGCEMVLVYTTSLKPQNNLNKLRPKLLLFLRIGALFLEALNYTIIVAFAFMYRNKGALEGKSLQGFSSA